jgi:aminopeptidase N
MFKKTAFLLSISALAAGAFAQNQCAVSKINSQNHVQLVSQAQKALESQYDAKYYHLDISAERTNKFVSGNVRQLVEVTAAGFDTFMVELYSTHIIDSSHINGVMMTPVRVGDAVYYILPSVLPVGSMIDATIYYHGTCPTLNGAAIGDGFNNGTSGSWGNQVTWSLSESYTAYEWFPCKQALTDKLDSSAVFVTTDSTNKVGSNGLLKNVVVVGNKKRYEWHNSHPIDYYLISVAIAKYVDYSIYAHPAGMTDSILVQNYVYDNPATLANFQADIDDTPELIEYFSDIYGLYPFADEKYGHCMAPFSGGMEHQTMTSLGFFDFTLIAHELAHQWFGDNVTCKTWNDIFVNESFATYSEQLALEHFDPSNAASNMLQVHNNVMSQAGGSVYCDDTTDVNRIFSSRLSYNKGCAIIHTLRFVLDNDTLFFNILKTYQNQYHDGTAGIQEFKLVAETLSGLDLTQFFGQWIYGEGYPTFTVRWNQVGSTFLLKSTETVSMSSVTPLFITPLQYKLTRSIGDTIIRVDQNIAIENYSFPVGGTVTTISIDPNNWVLNHGTVTHDVNLVGLAENEAMATHIRVFPNPAKDKLTVSSEENCLYTILDLTGKQLMQGTLQNGPTNIGIESLGEGMYFLQVKDASDKHVKTIKFIKE